MKPRPEAWQASQIHEALEALAVAGKIARAPQSPAATLSHFHADPVHQTVDEAATQLGLEARRVRVPFVHLKRFLRSGAPALIGMGSGANLKYVAVVRCHAAYVVVAIQPDLSLRYMSLNGFHRLVGESLAEPFVGEVEQILARVAIEGRRRRFVRSSLLNERLNELDVANCWLVGTPSHAGASATAADVRVIKRVGLLAGAHAVQHILFILSWWVLGAAILQGDNGSGWFVAWALLLVSIAPFRALEQWLLGSAAARLGIFLRQQLLNRIVRLPVDVARRDGVGRWLGRVIESEAVESMVVTGGHIGLVAAIELGLAVPILILGAGGALQGAALLAWCGVCLYMARRYWELRQRWTTSRLRVTDQMVESMVGYRTRLVQEHPATWHGQEDAALADYARLSTEMDRRAALLRAVIPRGWLVVSMAALIPAFVGHAAAATSLALAVGGMLIAYKALWKLVRGLSDLVDAVVSWEQIRPLLATHGSSEARKPSSHAQAAPVPPNEVILEARGLQYRYDRSRTPVLAGCDLKVSGRDRILIEGTSGVGKTTLAAVLGGRREAEAGLLLLGGLDRKTIGPTNWRERVVVTPQFNENHVLTGTLAFNLLLGRRWPASPADMADARRVCNRLGLGPLLERLPSGLMQMVGDGGWQLSHGERSRLFMARSLLQHPDVVIIDEGLGALDPETRLMCLRALLEQQSALILLVHA